jgi:endonuclease/exonuclease/phosphatase family metal-dependent hydrolase
VNYYTTGLAILAHQNYRVNTHNAGTPRDITNRGAQVRAVRRLKQTRICGHVRFDHVCGHSIDIFNTHLSLPTFFSKTFWKRGERMGHGANQIREAEALAEFVESERKSDRFVVVGDFNTRPGSPVYDYLTRQVGLRDVLGLHHNWDTYQSQHWPTAGFMQMRFHLDYIFAGRGLTWLDFEDSHPFGLKTSRFHGLSDHVPIIGRCLITR